MKPEELLEEWTSGESSGLWPQRVQALRNDLMRHTDVYIPRRIPEIEGYVERMKGEITKQLKAAVEETESEEEEAGEEE